MLDVYIWGMLAKNLKYDELLLILHQVYQLECFAATYRCWDSLHHSEWYDTESPDIARLEFKLVMICFWTDLVCDYIQLSTGIIDW